MAFAACRRFDSLVEAFEFILDRHVVRPGPERYWLTTNLGLTVLKERLPYLFRGECGEYPTTTGAIPRTSTYALADGRHLSFEDQESLRRMIPTLADRFIRDDYSLSEHQAYGLLQHYGMPTPMIDFTGDLGVAFAFAAAGTSSIGRIAALPMRLAGSQSLVTDLWSHPWAERPQRQAAFGVIPGLQIADLKSEAAQSRLGIKWYEFPVTAADRQYLVPRHHELVRFADDPSAGFLRFHLTEYVEAYQKLSPALADWLLERIPIAPRCYLVKEFDKSEVVVNYRAAAALPTFDLETEAAWSRRYWSAAYPDKSCDRMAAWNWPPVGSVVADPRTYHSVAPGQPCGKAEIQHGSGEAGGRV
jgi:hypothetical protein